MHMPFPTRYHTSFMTDVVRDVYFNRSTIITFTNIIVSYVICVALQLEIGAPKQGVQFIAGGTETTIIT